ncbi:MAG: 50S ribosomal protein L11 methyltransferase [Chlamydiales bacterium]|nr:50S ribosomal protein L11 methyltransferase [Chlamydiales bacterium]
MLLEFYFNWNHLDVESIAEALEDCVEMIGWQEDIKGIHLPRKFEGVVTSKNSQELALRLEILAISLGIDVPEISFKSTNDIDYLAENQKSFPPIEVKEFYIYGSHIKSSLPTNKTCLLLDAASAFGSGHHESTKGCLELIADLSKEYSFKNPLDLGCGSGILALAIAKAMSTKVTASDIDPESVRVTKENAKLNHVHNINVYESDGFSSLELQKHAPFDLIVANILAKPLCLLAKEMASYLIKDGQIVLSGLLNTQKEEVLAAYIKEGFHFRSELILGEWTTLNLTL